MVNGVPLVILAAAAYLYVVTCREQPLGRRYEIAAALFGLAGMLARSDFGLLPLCTACAYGLWDWRARKISQQFRAAASGLGGAFFGMMIIVAHSYLISGHLTQSSAKEKLFWSQIEGFSTHRALQILFSFFYPLANMQFYNTDYRSGWLYIGGSAIRLLTLCLLIYLLVRGLSARGRPLDQALVVGMVSTAIAYSILYRFDSAAVQPWYAANYEIPAALVVAASLSTIRGTFWRNFGAGVVALWVLAGVALSCEPTWPAQAGHYRAGIYLLDHPELQPAGAWNGGIIAYFSRQPVINLDGLVNDDVYQYVVTNTLGDYLGRRGVRYIFDTQDMFSGSMPRRGGYEGPGLTRCLEGKDEFLRNDTIDALGPINTREAVYQVDLRCLTVNGAVERASTSSPYHRSTHF